MPYRGVLKKKGVISYGTLWRKLSHQEREQYVPYQHILALYQLWHRLMAQARIASFMAQSYRGFQVGAAGLAFVPEEGYTGIGCYKVLLGWNKKPTPESETVCAEKMMLAQSEAAGTMCLVAMAVSGIPQEDSGSGLWPVTLHPCKKCRQMFRESPLIGSDTFVLTVHRKEYIYEVHTVGSLLRLHEQPLQEGV